MANFYFKQALSSSTHTVDTITTPPLKKLGADAYVLPCHGKYFHTGSLKYKAKEVDGLLNYIDFNFTLNATFMRN